MSPNLRRTFWHVRLIHGNHSTYWAKPKPSLAPFSTDTFMRIFRQSMTVAVNALTEREDLASLVETFDLYPWDVAADERAWNLTL